MKETGYFLPLHCLNGLQRDSIRDLIESAKHAHWVNMQLRINGQDKIVEADWVKSMVLLTVDREDRK